MSIHIHTAEDFPHDCNLDEAVLLKHELTYYIIRRRGRTRVVVHFEGYAPIVPFTQVQTFFAHVFGDLVRLQRLHPFRIAERLRITSTKSETGTIFRKEAQAALQKAVTNLDKKASKGCESRLAPVQSPAGQGSSSLRGLPSERSQAESPGARTPSRAHSPSLTSHPACR